MGICKITSVRQCLEYYAERASLHGFSADEIRTVPDGVRECLLYGQMARLGRLGGSPLVKIVWAQHSLMCVLKELDGLIEINE